MTIPSAATSPRSASWARWASPSTPRPGSGTGRSLAAAVARSSTRGGRRRRATSSSHRCPVTTCKPGSATFPYPGIEADVVNDKGQSVDAGYLVIKRPWPGMLRGIYGDPERFVKQYWSQIPGMYFTGDGAKRDKEG